MLKRTAAAFFLASVLALPNTVTAVGLAPTTYQVIGGSIVDGAGSGKPRSRSLSGEFSGAPFSPLAFGPIHFGETLLISDFLLEAGNQSFEPRLPVVIDGAFALELRIANGISFVDGRVTRASWQANGQLVNRDDETATYRYFEFRSGSGPRNIVSGQAFDFSLLPRRIELRGTLHEILQSYRLPRDKCTAPILPVLPAPMPPIHGGVVSMNGPEVSLDLRQGSVSGRGGATIAYGPLDLAPDKEVRFREPTGRLALKRVAEDSVPIEGRLMKGGAVVFVNPGGTGFTASVPVPTLEQLGITALNGATISVDEAGEALTVSSDGDLFIAGDSIDLSGLPDLMSLTIETLGNITIDGSLDLPSEISVHINAGGDISAGGILDPRDDISTMPDPITALVICSNPLPIFPNEQTEIGSFSLIATAAQPIDIVVRPRRVNPLSARPINVGIATTDELDAQDIDLDSLRFGPGEAEARADDNRRVSMSDFNHDGRRDLIVRFDGPEAGFALGDTQACLFGATHSGVQIEGCTEINTRPGVHRTRRTRRK